MRTTPELLSMLRAGETVGRATPQERRFLAAAHRVLKIAEQLDDALEDLGLAAEKLRVPGVEGHLLDFRPLGGQIEEDVERVASMLGGHRELAKKGG